jgi:predicted NACHT family NTPase
MSYIKPVIKFYDRFDDLDNESEIYAYHLDKTDWNEIYSKSIILLLAEPGYGKTRMLKEIVIESTTIDRSAIYIDLKNVTLNIEEYIKEITSTCQIFASSEKEEEEINKCQKIKSEKFELQNSQNIIICMDALDEVQIGDKYATLIDNIKEFIQKYDQCNIIISCRTHHYKRYKSIFTGVPFEYCKIFDFKNEHIESFLKNQDIKEPVIQKVMGHVSDSYLMNILGTPRYLSMYVKLIRENNADEVSKLNRTDLFESFIYGKLEKEKEKDESLIDIDIVKRVLEKLALIMEIYQSNTLKMDDLLTYFDNIDSTLTKSFLEIEKWQVLIDKSLIKYNI